MVRIFVVTAAASLAGTIAICATGNSHAADELTVPRFLESDKPPLTSYRAKRHLEASTRGGAMTASLDAWTELLPDGSFAFEVIREGGSGLMREYVLRAALIEERQARITHELEAASLTPDNYVMQPTDAAGDLTKIALTPKRKARMLIVGAAFVTRGESDLVQIEGLLATLPSFWTRKVEIAQRYARIAGVRVPIEMRSRADILLVGASSFSMTYEYVMVNGRGLAGLSSPRAPSPRCAAPGCGRP